jgi:uncharacterized protein
MKTKVITYSGTIIDPFNPDPDKIHIEDIATHLSRENRWGNATPFPYSVAQHSILCANRAPVDIVLETLMHDAAEYLFKDLPSPIKELMPGYKEAETRLLEVIFKKYGLQWPMPEGVTDVDMEMRRFERASFWEAGEAIEPMSQQEAKRLFIHMFRSLIRMRL